MLPRNRNNTWQGLAAMRMCKRKARDESRWRAARCVNKAWADLPIPQIEVVFYSTEPFFQLQS